MRLLPRDSSPSVLSMLVCHDWCNICFFLSCDCRHDHVACARFVMLFFRVYVCVRFVNVRT